MTTLREAAKLALEVLENLDVYGEYTKNATVRELRKVLAEPQRKPLTNEELDALAIDEDGLPNSHFEFARAIERAHGIGGEE